MAHVGGQANPDGFDHLKASFAADAQGNNQGNGKLTLKWEDQTGGGDKDFNDLVIAATGFKQALNPPAPAVFTYTAQASDVDGDTLRYSLSQAPTGASIDSLSGVVSWSTTVAGNYNFTISVSDGTGGVTQQAFTLTVNAAGTTTNTGASAQVATSLTATSSASIMVSSSAVSAALGDSNPTISYIVVNSGSASTSIVDSSSEGALCVNWSGEAQKMINATAGEQWVGAFLGTAPDSRSLAEKTGLTVRVNG